jgi:hypothetical protein
VKGERRNETTLAGGVSSGEPFPCDPDIAEKG